MDLSSVIGSRGLYSPGSGQRHMAGCCTHGREPSGSLNYGEFLGWLRNHQLWKEGSVTCGETYG